MVRVKVLYKKTSMLQVALSTQLEEKLMSEINQTGLSRSEVARVALDEYLSRKSRERATLPQDWERR